MSRNRTAFLCFFGVVVIAVLLFYYVGFGLSHTRVYNQYRAELEDAAKIAQKYDWVQVIPGVFNTHAFGRTGDGEIVSVQDENRLKQILVSLQWDYVISIDYPPSEETKTRRLIVGQGAGFSISYLARYEGSVDTSQVQSDYPGYAITQMDEHWWYVR